MTEKPKNEILEKLKKQLAYTNGVLTTDITDDLKFKPETGRPLTLKETRLLDEAASSPANGKEGPVQDTATMKISVGFAEDELTWLLKQNPSWQVVSKGLDPQKGWWIRIKLPFPIDPYSYPTYKQP
jgi:hypothetical protein